MIYSGAPAIFKVGPLDILFGTAWEPTSAEPSYGILYIILTSIIGTAMAILIGVPVGVLTAVFLAEVAPPKLAAVVKPGRGAFGRNPFRYLRIAGTFNIEPDNV